jgi:hypothetical protein
MEFRLRDYLANNNGYNLRRIDSGLVFDSIEHPYPGGRLDILSYKKIRGVEVPVGLELKANEYSIIPATNQVLRHINYLRKENGMLLYIARYFPREFFKKLENLYDDGLLVFYQVTASNEYESFKFTKFSKTDIMKFRFNPVHEATKSIIYNLPNAASSTGRRIARNLGSGRITEAIVSTIFRSAGRSVKGVLIDIMDKNGNNKKRL